ALQAHTFHRQQATFHREAIGRGVAADIAASSQNAMARDDQWIAVLSHHTADRAGSSGRATLGRQVSIGFRLTPRNLSAGGDHALAERGQVLQRKGHVGEIDRLAASEQFQANNEAGGPLRNFFSLTYGGDATE